MTGTYRGPLRKLSGRSMLIKDETATHYLVQFNQYILLTKSEFTRAGFALDLSTVVENGRVQLGLGWVLLRKDQVDVPI